MQHYEDDIVAMPTVTSPSSNKPSNTLTTNNFRACFKILHIGKIKKAISSLLSFGTSDPRSEAIQAQLASKHPTRKFEIVAPTQEHITQERATFSFDDFCNTVKFFGRQIAPGLGGCKNEHIQALFFNDNSSVSTLAKDALPQFYRVCLHIAQCTVPWYFFTAFTSVRMVALNKEDSSSVTVDGVPDVRPVAMGNRIRTLITSCLMDPFYLNSVIISILPSIVLVFEVAFHNVYLQ